MTNQQLNDMSVTRKGFNAYESFCFLCKLSAILAAYALLL
ncbi:hypothetical protein AZO1586I_101 [Bathymodiolus thermophilus thioautotrophic gill symbiont]|uniref:Uncharacterized protein n=1 Tax=Bathymodiolus thermophilus thioautotrophic gill symbiont TaxID=2360 RepID=A0ABM8M7B8_9GAMM|nr:hypothetical protein AZO1586I_101 [Bathymodiolus thermophilus thioautotrophic gill symbiont]